MLIHVKNKSCRNKTLSIAHAVQNSYPNNCILQSFQIKLSDTSATNENRVFLPAVVELPVTGKVQYPVDATFSLTPN